MIINSVFNHKHALLWSFCLLLLFARGKEKDDNKLMFTEVNGQFTHLTVKGVLGIVGSSKRNIINEKIKQFDDCYVKPLLLR